MAASKAVLPDGIKLVSERSVRVVPKSDGIDVFSQTAFAHVLRLERRRTERSGNPFILVLLSGWDSKDAGHSGLVGNVARAISSCTRETDVLGWHDEDETLGLLLTEVGKADDQTVGVITQKIAGALQRFVDPEEFSRLELAFYVFPRPSGGDPADKQEDVIYPDLSKRTARERRDRILKRAVDIAGSLFALVALLPVFAFIAVLVKITSRGPVLYCQQRVGQYGRLFSFFKFRSMYADNDPAIHQDYVARLIMGTDDVRHEDGTYKLVKDPRVTPLGRLIRRTSLDELPQFMNVLRGDMSLVGPRPPVPYEFELYRPWHKRRVLEIQPGLTGLWQIEGRSRTTFDEMVRMDLRYAKTRSLLRDLVIILQTPGAMFSGNGAF
jgi:lipopolysaccharide/colanic/teichoic acid biosynthesis glycosyltransferase